MKLMNRINKYLDDDEYKIIIKKDNVDIINYSEIIDFSVSNITVKCKDRIITIEGVNLIITKMMESEILVMGNICDVRIK